MDAEGRHLLVGPRSKALWGVDRDNIIDRTTHQLLPKELADSLIAQDRAVLETGRLVEQEDDVVLDDGVHTILTIKFPIPDAEADRPGIGAVSLGITGRKRIEAEVRRLNEELASRIEARTSELHATREALVRNQSLAALGELTGSVAHDLRNPLCAIASSVDVIQNKCQAAKVDVDRALVRVQRNIKRCDGLIRELLDFTRVKGLHPEPTELDPWLSEVLEEQPVPTWITVNRELRAGGATVAFDREQIRRAVTNVLENACQAMAIDEDTNGSTSPRQLTVATRRSQGRIEIEVADTGPGIPEQALSKVLEPLFSTKSLGTGLGLPIVQRIMERHSGGLEIASAAQRGTQVRLWLPLAQATERGAPA
jgi:signal transduction histidine kinase